MHRSHLTPSRRARGLTLMELVVVLVVLAALAGVLVPLLPNMLTRAHSSTTAANITEVGKALQLYEGTTLRAPNGWDSLIGEDGETLRDDRFTVVDLGEEGNERIQDALNAAGITTSYQLSPSIQGNGRPEGHSNEPQNGRINTFDPYADPPVAYDLTDDGSVVTLGPATNEMDRFNLVNPDDDDNIEAYVVFGVGAQLTALDHTMSEAPVHFPGQGDLDPTQAYGRMVAIYAIPATGPARLVRVGAVHNDHLDSMGHLMEEFYETTN